MTIAPTPPQTLLTNANVVGYPRGPYSLLIENGLVVTITQGLIVPERGAEVLDVRGGWVAPVRRRVLCPR